MCGVCLRGNRPKSQSRINKAENQQSEPNGYLAVISQINTAVSMLPLFANCSIFPSIWSSVALGNNLRPTEGKIADLVLLAANPIDDR
jgi:hypothetical protein